LTIQLPKAIHNNLRFLIVEVSTQVANLQQFITTDDTTDLAGIGSRDGYTFNLKTRIHNACYKHMFKGGNHEHEIAAYRAINSIANNLERIAELCTDCLIQLNGLNRRKHFYYDNYDKLLDRVALSISLIERASQNGDSELALKIGQTQRELNRRCHELTEEYSTILKTGNDTDDLLVSLFVVNSIKNMGYALLKICEAILSGNLGQSITMDRYHSLSDFVSHLKKDTGSGKLIVETIAETRSGSAISGISHANKEDIIAIFKDGKKSKLKEELHSVESWHEIYPGIAPKILSYRKQGQSAALLIEHLQGSTFEKIVIQGSNKLQKKALKQLLKTLESIWNKTRQDNLAPIDYIKQLNKRLPAVYALHPEFEQDQCKVAGFTLPNYSQLLNLASQLEHQLTAPFSVYIHGDFNTDNILFDPVAGKINFIDLHRSQYMDYVQDVSVFMVSNYRLQALDQLHRYRVLIVNQAMYQFAANFARQNNDKTFELRLGLGLARSLATSTRFTLDKTQAKAMFYRSRYLIESVINLKPCQHAEFRVPIKEIFVG
jgi:aminoglycoside phosphotransferase (APT) family kinase protein